MDRRRRFDRGKYPDRGRDGRRDGRDPRRRGRSSESSKKRFKLGDFQMKRILGFGSFSEVRKCVLRETGRVYAVKIIPKALVMKKKKTRHVSSEKKALILLKRHPLVCSLKCTFQDRRCLYFVLEFVPNGELFTMWKRHERFSLEATRYYCAQITHVMQFIHNCGIIHMDLKPENLILDESFNLRLVDFGTCLFLNNESTVGLNVLGTPEYTAPELVQRTPDQGITFSVDYWSLGVIIFQLLSGRHPFKSGSNYLLFQKIINMDFEIPDDIPEVGKDIIKKLLVLDPELRLGYRNPEELRAHPFFKGIDWDGIGTGKLTPPPFSDKEIKISPPPSSSDDKKKDNDNDSEEDEGEIEDEKQKAREKEEEEEEDEGEIEDRKKEEEEDTSRKVTTTTTTTKKKKKMTTKTKTNNKLSTTTKKKKKNVAGGTTSSNNKKKKKKKKKVKKRKKKKKDDGK